MPYTEVVQFINKVGASTRQKGYKITDDLVVAYPTPFGSSSDNRWKVFSITSGRPIVDLTFTNEQDATEFAKWMEQLYGDYLFLLTEYPRMNIPDVCMWTVKDGIRMKVTLDTVIHSTGVALTTQQDRDTITLEDVRRAYDKAKGAEVEYEIQNNFTPK